ncbi:MAG: TetR/AcrR family transcriptional regulator [Planctomycetota bacterium]|nr:TetR/AcrR family transcriptional regulator [Planctomycetota bacterium]
MGRKSSREAILDALERVIATHGVTQVTLEAVAQEAGISKGGLLYHFSNKKEMLLRMLERSAARFDDLVQSIKEALPETPGRAVKAHILARLRETSRINIAPSKFVGLLDDEELKNFVTEIKRREFHEITAMTGQREKISLLLLAVEGMWMMELFQIPALSPEFRKKLEARLLAMVDDEDGAQDMRLVGSRATGA